MFPSRTNGRSGFRPWLSALVVVALAVLGPATIAVTAASARSHEVIHAKDNKNKKKKSNTTSTAAAKGLPTDACALLTIDEVRTLLPSTREARSQAPPAGSGIEVVACDWSTVLAVDAPPDQAKRLSLGFEILRGAPDSALKRQIAASGGTQIPNLGLAAKVQTLGTAGDATLTAVYPGGMLMTIEYLARDGVNRSNDLIALARKADSRF